MILLDTSGLLAAIDSSQRGHRRAAAVLRETTEPLLLSPFVLAELDYLLATRVGLGMVNAPGTIDAGYRGEIKVTLINTDRVTPIVLERGDRIAQLIIQRVEQAGRGA